MYQTPDWLRLFSLAIHGDKWAINECRTDRFKTEVRQWYKDDVKAEEVLDLLNDKLDAIW